MVDSHLGLNGVDVVQLVDVDQEREPAHAQNPLQLEGGNLANNMHRKARSAQVSDSYRRLVTLLTVNL